MSNHHHIFNQAPTKWPKGENATPYEVLKGELGLPIPIGHMFRDCFSLFARKINTLQKRVGAVIRDRTKTVLVNSPEQAITLLIYIFLNPVRAGIVNHPSEYLYSNYNQYAHGKKGYFKDLFTYHPAYLALGNTWTKRRRVFRRLVEAALKEWAHKRWRAISGAFKVGTEKAGHLLKQYRIFAEYWIFKKGVYFQNTGPPDS